MRGPLGGMRVLSLEQYGAGPFGTQHLADLGAEVIKIENRAWGGDYARTIGPYFVEGAEEGSASMFFHAVNRGKKSLALDISGDEGREVFHRLVGGADAVANNLRGDVPGKLGVTYSDLSAHNPAVVCAHCTGYGRNGERRDWPGYDFLMQAEAGYFHMSGEPDGPPARMGLSVVDFMAGSYLALGIVSAVMSARETGLGRDVDVSLYDTALFNMNYLAVWALNGEYEPERVRRSAHASLVPCQLYRTRDGWIYVMCNKEKFWRILCERIGRPDLAEDSRYATFKERLERRDELTGILDAALSARTTGEWLGRFAGGVPAAPVRSAREALMDPLPGAAPSESELRFPGGQKVRTLASPIKAGSPEEGAPCSGLGADTVAILEEAGYTGREIEALRERGVI